MIKSVSHPDVAALASAEGIDAQPDLALLSAVAALPGGLRNVENAIRMAALFAGKDRITGAHIKAAVVDPALPQIATALGLDAGAGLDTILATLREGQAPDPAQYVPMAEVTALLRERNTRIAVLSEQAVKRRIDDAVPTGVISPGMRDWATSLCSSDPDSFDTFVHSIGPVFGHLFKVRDWTLPDATGTAGLGPDAKAIAAQLGLPATALR